MDINASKSEDGNIIMAQTAFYLPDSITHNTYVLQVLGICDGYTVCLYNFCLILRSFHGKVLGFPSLHIILHWSLTAHRLNPTLQSE